jgi:Mn-dependent DtxR family transcriptional regulator
MPIYLPKWVEVMVMLHNMPDRERYCQRLYRKLNMNSSHVRTMIHHLERRCLIKGVPNQRIRYIRLTERGSALAELALRMKCVLKEVGVDG